MFTIITVPDNRLFKQSRRVTFPLSQEDRDLIEAMLEVCRGAADKPKRLVGLAAPQLGILKRIIVVDFVADGTGKTGDLRVMINPQLINRSPVIEVGPEGCGSIPTVAGIVPRSKDVTFVYENESGIKSEVTTVEGYTARICQHEFDHLEGKLFPDRMEVGRRLHELEDGEFPAYRKDEAWKTWPRHKSANWWKEIKSQAGL